MKRAARQEVAPLLDDQAIGLEARSSGDDHLSLRLWLRLLACSTDIGRCWGQPSRTAVNTSSGKRSRCASVPP